MNKVLEWEDGEEKYSESEDGEHEEEANANEEAITIEETL